MYGSATRVFSFLMIAIGVVILIRTLAAGFGVGILLGVLFVAAGVGRLIVSRRRV